MSQSDRGRGRGRGSRGGRGGYRGRGGSHSHSPHSPVHERHDFNPPRHEYQSGSHYPRNEYPASAPPPPPPSYSQPHHAPPHAHPPPPPPQYPQPSAAPYQISVSVVSQPHSPDPHPVPPRDPYRYDAHHSRPQDPYYRDDYYDHPRPDSYYGERPRAASPPYDPRQERYYHPRDVNPGHPGHGEAYGHRSPPPASYPPSQSRQHSTPQERRYSDRRDRYPPQTHPQEPPPPYESLSHERAHYPGEPQRRSGPPSNPRRNERIQREDLHSNIGDSAGHSREPAHRQRAENFQQQGSGLADREANANREGKQQRTHWKKPGKPLGHGASVESLPSHTSNFSSLESEGDVGSHTSQGSRSRGKWRGRGRGWNRRQGSNQGRGGFQQSQKGKFQSMPDLGDGGSYDYPKDSGKSCKEMDTPVRITKAVLQIMMGFENAQKLKDTVYGHFDENEEVDLQFVEDSIICNDKRGVCVLMLHTESKQLAKRAVKNLYQNLRKGLNTKVTFEISSAEEEGRVRKEESPNIISSDAGKTWKKPEKIYQSDLKTTTKDSDKNKTKGSQEKAKKDEAAGEKSCDDKGEGVGRVKGPVPVPLPTKVTVTVEKIFPQNEDLFNFLKKAAGEEISQCKCELLSELITGATSKTVCELAATSKAAAKRIMKALNDSTLDGVQIYCQRKP